MTKATVISVKKALENLTCYDERTPQTKDEDMADAFAVLSDYRDGAIYVGHYKGFSEWERHTAGDEIVMVLGGKTNLVLLTEEGEKSNHLVQDGVLVVPKNVWHRFDSPEGVQVLTVTPQ